RHSSVVRLWARDARRSIAATFQLSPSRAGSRNALSQSGLGYLGLRRRIRRVLPASRLLVPVLLRLSRLRLDSNPVARGLVLDLATGSRLGGLVRPGLLAWGGIRRTGSSGRPRLG